MCTYMFMTWSVTTSACTARAHSDSEYALVDYKGIGVIPVFSIQIYDELKSHWQSLGFAEGIGPQKRRAALCRSRSPPGVDLGLQRLLLGPTEDRQTERAFRDEGVAGHGFERFRQAVVHQFVIARDDPDLAFDFDPDF